MELGTIIILVLFVLIYFGTKRDRKNAIHSIKSYIDMEHAMRDKDAYKEMIDEQKKQCDDYYKKKQDDKEFMEELISKIEEKEKMTHTTINIICSSCNKNLSGVLYDLFNIDKDYSITCTKCNNQNIFKGKAGIVDAEIASDAIEIMYVADIINT